MFEEARPPGEAGGLGAVQSGGRGNADHVGGCAEVWARPGGPGHPPERRARLMGDIFGRLMNARDIVGAVEGGSRMEPRLLVSTQ